MLSACNKSSVVISNYLTYDFRAILRAVRDNKCNINSIIAALGQVNDISKGHTNGSNSVLNWNRKLMNDQRKLFSGKHYFSMKQNK